MKLCLKDRDSQERVVRRRRANRKCASKEKARCRRAGKPFANKRATSRLAVPAVISIDNPANRKTFCRFLRMFRERALGNREHIVLSFEDTEIIRPSAMILFIAEVDRARRIFGPNFSVRLSNVRNKTVKQLLVQIGMYELCSMIPPKLRPSTFEDNVRHWRFATGERANESTNDAFAAIEGLISEELRGGMWKGVSEAVINSVLHAYEQPRNVPGPRMKHKRWWMFSQERDEELTVVVCDLGIGIPRSLPLNWDESLLSRLRSAVGEGGADVTALKAALQLGRSSTGHGHRGKGLPQIWNAVQSPNANERTGIMIHSNRGKVAWNGKDRKEFSHQFETSIFGTVVMWTVPLSREAMT